MDPAILHVDMDAFFASVEVLDDPSLRGRPVIVGGTPDSRGVVSAASYEARRFGVRSAMALTRAGRLCPDGVFLPVRMKRYAEVSARIFTIFAETTPLVEGLSLDEAFLDVRASRRLFGTGVEIGHRIRNRIRDELGLPCSVGVAPVKFVAKIASDLEKPNGFVVVSPALVLDFLAPLPIERLWGVGEVTAEKLKNLGLTRVGDLRAAGEAFLEDRFGDTGAHLFRLSMGDDERPVVPESDRKSVGHETTFPEDVADLDILLSALFGISEEVAWRARRGGHRGRRVSMKIRYAPFETHTSQTTLASATNLTSEIWEAARSLFLANARVPPRKVRLLGVSLGALGDGPDRQMGLFSETTRERARRVDLALDEIKAKLGRSSIRRAAGDAARKRKR